MVEYFLVKLSDRVFDRENTGPLFLSYISWDDQSLMLHYAYTLVLIANTICGVH